MRRIKDKLFNPDRTPMAGARVVFEFDKPGSHPDGQYPTQARVEAVADETGEIEVDLVENGGFSNQAPIRCTLPDGSNFTFYIPEGNGDLTLDDLRLASAPPPSTTLARIEDLAAQLLQQAEALDELADDLQSHVVTADAHPEYLTQAEGDERYAPINGGGGGATNLTHSRTANTVTVASSTGTATTIPAATNEFAGILDSERATKIDGLPQPAQIVLLQAVAPGTQQLGHFNINGIGRVGKLGIGSNPSGVHNQLTVGPTPNVVNNAVSVFSIPNSSAGADIALFTREIDGFPILSINYFGLTTFVDLAEFYGSFRVQGGHTRVRRLGIGETTGPASMQVWQHCERVSPEFGTVAAGGEVTVSVTVQGAAYNDCVDVFDLDGVTQPGIQFLARVTAANTVQLKVHNMTAAPIAVLNGGFALVLRRFE